MSRTPVAKCEECGYEITTTSRVCINCGEKIYRYEGSIYSKLVKRIVFFAIAVYILLSALKLL